MIQYRIFSENKWISPMLDTEQAKTLLRKVCTTFDDYDPSAAALEKVRREVLEILG